MQFQVRSSQCSRPCFVGMYVHVVGKYVIFAMFTDKMTDKSNHTILSQIDFPSDLRRLPVDRLPEVCNELRQYILGTLADNPGHLASSLGVVELTVALHYVFNTPFDRLLWDVGHQAYAHKILTGRRDRFHTNRKLHGLKPFPSPSESEYDAFVAGHASNSISAALGMSVAARGEGGSADRHIVAVIGDGSMSGGLAFEGLNNTSSTPNNLLIVLNDNNMSIDKGVGGMHQYLHRLHTNKIYNRLRFTLSQKMLHGGLLSEDGRNVLLRFNNSIKSLLSRQQNVFEGLNIRYFGPVDGHDVAELVRSLQVVKDMRGPKLLHIRTVKGKGYVPAERAAQVWHAPGKFDIRTGERLQSESVAQPPLFQDVFGHTLLELARANDKIVGVTPAMPSGCSMNILMKEMPDRAFDVGIAEGHAVTFSAGMAQGGLVPFCNIYSSFAQRAYDNIIHDVAIERLQVVLCLDRAGLVGEDGPTHHGAFDLAALRPVPNLVIASPMDECELRHMMYTAQLPGTGPMVIRYPRGRGVRVDWRVPFRELSIGKGRQLKEGRDVAVLTLGPLGNMAARAVELFEEKHPDKSVALFDMRFLKPLDEELLASVGERFNCVVTVEDGVVAGGFGSAVLEFMSDNGFSPAVCRLGLPDEFVEHGSVEQLRRIVGLDCEGLVERLERITQTNN